jgi:hypothetical protein
MARLCRVCRLVPPPSAAFEGVSARAAADSGLTVALVCAYSPTMLTDHFRSRQSPAFVALRPSQPEPNRSRRPHAPATVDAMRQLVTATTLPMRVIAARTGTSATTVSRRARRHGWLRPKTGFPEDQWTAEGRRKLRRSAIAEALLAQAERLAFETEMNPTARTRSILQAARLVRLSRKLDDEEAAGTRRRRRRCPTTPKASV